VCAKSLSILSGKDQEGSARCALEFEFIEVTKLEEG
jgi:hypothetical protein